MQLLLGILLFLLTSIFYTSNSYAIDVSVSPPIRTENTDAVTVTYSGLISGEDYWVCWDNDPTQCKNNNGAGRKKFTASGGQISVTVCGNGEGNVQEGACANDEWFQARDDYNMRLYKASDCCDNGHDVANANFDIDHFFPSYDIQPPNPKTGEQFSISFSGTRRQHTRESRNDYKVFLEKRDGTDLQDHSCVAVQIIPGSTCVFTGVEAGAYQFDVTEKDDGYSYYIIELTIDDDGGEVGNVFKDPDNHDDLDDGGGGGGSGRNPCSNAGCETAIGNIPTDLKGFAESILNIATGLAGGIALILMVFGSIQVLTSQGDQQKLNGGRERIVAAIAGLLFLIFSVLILRFIGINLLGGIPGF